MSYMGNRVYESDLSKPRTWCKPSFLDSCVDRHFLLTKSFDDTKELGYGKNMVWNVWGVGVLGVRFWRVRYIWCSWSHVMLANSVLFRDLAALSSKWKQKSCWNVHYSRGEHVCALQSRWACGHRAKVCQETEHLLILLHSKQDREEGMKSLPPAEQALCSEQILGSG